MRYIFFVYVFLFVGCSAAASLPDRIEVTNEHTNYTLNFNIDTNNIPTNITNINKWVKINIKYSLASNLNGNIQEWQSPEKTLSNRTGVCIDKAILFLALVYVQTGVEGTIYYLQSKSITNLRHVVTTVGWEVYDPTAGSVNNEIGTNWTILGQSSFRGVMYLVRNQKKLYNID